MRKLGLAMAGGIATAVVAVATGPAPATVSESGGSHAYSRHGPAQTSAQIPAGRLGVTER